MVERVQQVAEACIKDMQEYDSFLRKDLPARQVNLQANDFLANIYYFRICSYTEQIAVINYLEKFISEHKDVGVVFKFFFLMMLVMSLRACIMQIFVVNY